MRVRVFSGTKLLVFIPLLSLRVASNCTIRPHPTLCDCGNYIRSTVDYNRGLIDSQLSLQNRTNALKLQRNKRLYWCMYTEYERKSQETSVIVQRFRSLFAASHSIRSPADDVHYYARPQPATEPALPPSIHPVMHFLLTDTLAVYMHISLCVWLMSAGTLCASLLWLRSNLRALTAKEKAK